MPTDLRPFLQHAAGIALILAGVAFENLLGPSPIGWAFVFVGMGISWYLQRQTLRSLPFLRSLAALGGIALLSLWVTTDISQSQAQVNQVIVNIILVYFLANWFITHSYHQLYMVALLLMGGILALSTPFLVEWQQYKIGLIPNQIYDALPLVLSDPVHPNIMASLMLMLFPLALILFFTVEAPPRYKWGYGLVAGLMLFVLFLTRSRGGYLAGAIGVIWVLWVMQQRWLAFATLGLMSIAGLIVVLNEPVQTTTAVSGLSDPGTLQFRFSVWQLALEMIRDFPFTGVGLGQFNVVAERLYPYPPANSPGAHNLYLHIAAELGLPALLVYLTIILGALSRVIKAKIWQQPSPLLLGSMIGVSLMLLHGFVDITVWGTRMSFIPWLLIAPLIAFTYRQQQEDTPS